MLSSREALRLIDVNANRAAEGIRTVEDIARLVFENQVASRMLKELRHELGSITQAIPQMERLAARDTQSDAGTKTTLPSESSRGDLTNVISAACERTTQSLRCLEEFSKLLPAEIQASTESPFKRLRYRAYDVLADVQQMLARPKLDDAAQLYLLIDCEQALPQFTSYVKQLAKAGVDILQIRDKHADGAKLLAYARAAREELVDTSCKLIINDRVDIALAAQADGVHVGQDDLPIREVRRLVPGSMLVGISTHDIEQARTAQTDGADYIGCGPTFRSQTKSFSDFPGTRFLHEVANEISVPAFAIGGIGAVNLSEVLETGCRRIAVSNVIHSADVPVDRARQLKSTLSNAAAQSVSADV
ncbi:MAG: thiamine phosphate synthase [Aureliella sp.]